MPEKPRDDAAKALKENTSSSPSNNKPTTQNGGGKSPPSDRTDTGFMNRIDPITSILMKFPNRQEK
ncbi:hypothetical protein PV11_00025 [Exophiala sideris]|uniref:Uncharacterized protein n=1 Tax=Exophiala sideris TaxID=1016849 RepID=A0A0D1YS21_9EURO|nr:hypothetical protein PV11_00025 [Exophiala sideris]